MCFSQLPWFQSCFETRTAKWPLVSSKVSTDIGLPYAFNWARVCVCVGSRNGLSCLVRQSTPSRPKPLHSPTCKQCVIDKSLHLHIIQLMNNNYTIEEIWRPVAFVYSFDCVQDCLKSSAWHVCCHRRHFHHLTLQQISGWFDDRIPVYKAILETGRYSECCWVVDVAYANVVLLTLSNCFCTSVRLVIVTCCNFHGKIF